MSSLSDSSSDGVTLQEGFVEALYILPLNVKTGGIDAYEGNGCQVVLRICPVHGSGDMLLLAVGLGKVSKSEVCVG